MKKYEISLKFECITEFPPLNYVTQEYSEKSVMLTVKEHADRHKIPYSFLQEKGIIFIEVFDADHNIYEEPILLEPDFSYL